MAAAAHIAATEGLQGVTTTRLVQSANVSRSTLYELFESKDACVVAAADHALDELVAMLDDAVAGDGAAPERMVRALEALLRFCSERSAQARLCLVEVAGAGPVGAARRSGGMERIQTVLEPLVHETSPSAPPLTADLLVGGICSVVAAQLRAGRTEAIPELLPELLALVESVLGADR
jgi:AcrR family transcriptional regulator